jgi:hypothetical protein
MLDLEKDDREQIKLSNWKNFLQRIGANEQINVARK